MSRAISLAIWMETTMHNMSLLCVVIHIIYNMPLFYMKSNIPCNSALPYIITIGLLYTEDNMIYNMALIVCNSPYHVKHVSIVCYHMWYGALWYIVGLVLWIRLTMHNMAPCSKCILYVIRLFTCNRIIYVIGRDKGYCGIIQPYCWCNKHIYIRVPYHIIYAIII